MGLDVKAEVRLEAGDGGVRTAAGDLSNVSNLRNKHEQPSRNQEDRQAKSTS